MNCNKTYTILIDMDDTIENLLVPWISWLNSKYGTFVKPEEVIDWDIDKFFPTLTRYEVFEPVYTEDFWDMVMPKDGAVEYVKKLIDDGHKVYICTNSNYKTLKSKMDKALFRYFNYLTWSNVIIARDKQMVNADFLIDDGVHNIIGGGYQGILMDAPHNWYFDEKAHGVFRAKTWEDVYRYITESEK